MESQLLAPCRIDFDATGDDKERESLPVYLRIKPHDEEEMSIKVIDATTVETNHAFRANKKATFSHIFTEDATQQEVFNVTTGPLVQKFLDGANVMTFAYGVTSSGKTYTIMGNHSAPGIIPLTLEKIFGHFKSKISGSKPTHKPVLFENTQEVTDDELMSLERAKQSLVSKIKGTTSGFEQYDFMSATADNNSTTNAILGTTSCSVWISIYEIYNEVVTDLLHNEIRTKRRALNIGQDSKGRTFVKDLTQFPVRTAADAYGLLQFAKQNLAKASTKLNDSSSRSHMVFNIRMVHWGGSVRDPFVNQFVISDLAGSERQAKTGTSGATLKQASAINNSLLVLGRCLEALRKKDKGISAPFRDSKLTRMLNPFFTLGGYVSLIICVNPHVMLQDETMDTIRFSAIASEIVQDPIRPLERLRQLRRLTQGCIDSSPAKQVEDSRVEHWQEAVNGANVYDGVTYLEVKASYFNDMARDILRAEKFLTANEDEIKSLNERLREAEASKENIRLMYEDRMKAQRQKMAQQKKDYEETIKALADETVQDLEEEIKGLKEKYTKYKDGYAKVSEYLKDKLWPEMNLFRERFGYLPEFPAKDGAEAEEPKPENTIRYWQDKLQEKEDAMRALKKTFARKAEQMASLNKEMHDQRKLTTAAEKDAFQARESSKKSALRVQEMEEKLRNLTRKLEDQDSLLDQVSELKQAVLSGEESKESLIAEHEIILNSVKEELDNVKAELRNKAQELGETNEQLKEARSTISQLEKSISNLQNATASTNEIEEQLRSENKKLQEKVAHLDKALSKERKEVSDLQEHVMILRDDLDRAADKEVELKNREHQLSLKMKEARVSRTNENELAKLKDELKRLQLISDQQRELVAEKDVVVHAQSAELEDLRDKVTTIEILGSQMEKLSEENCDQRNIIKTLQSQNRRLESEVKRTRELEVEVEFLQRKLENQQKRILKDCPQTERPYRRRRSASASDMDLKFKTPVTEKPRRRIRMDNDENSVLDKTLEKSIRDTSPLPTPYRTRSSRKITK